MLDNSGIPPAICSNRLDRGLCGKEPGCVAGW